MSYVQRVIDASLGRILRWAGGQWARGADRRGRQQEMHAALLEAMAAAITQADQLGRGYTTESNLERELTVAEGRVSVATGQIADDELAGIGEAFVAASGVVAGQDARGQAWLDARSSLRELRDKAAARIREVQRAD